MRGRGRKPQHLGQRTFDSSGPDVKIRGSAAQIYEKYQALARDANSSGDRVGAENYLQHAEHYYRILVANQVANGRNGAAPGRENRLEGEGSSSEDEAERDGQHQPAFSQSADEMPSPQDG
jgi:hypothetical protein